MLLPPNASDLIAKLKTTREENEAILLQNEADAAELESLKEQVGTPLFFHDQY